MKRSWPWGMFMNSLGLSLNSWACLWSNETNGACSWILWKGRCSICLTKAVGDIWTPLQAWRPWASCNSRCSRQTDHIVATHDYHLPSPCDSQLRGSYCSAHACNLKVQFVCDMICEHTCISSVWCCLSSRPVTEFIQIVPGAEDPFTLSILDRRRTTWPWWWIVSIQEVLILLLFEMLTMGWVFPPWPLQRTAPGSTTLPRLVRFEECCCSSSTAPELSLPWMNKTSSINLIVINNFVAGCGWSCGTCTRILTSSICHCEKSWRLVHCWWNTDGFWSDRCQLLGTPESGCYSRYRYTCQGHQHSIMDMCDLTSLYRKEWVLVLLVYK